MNAPLPALTLERVFAAPRELVFRAWVEPHRLAQWWGPYGFTVEACKIEPTPGGALHIETRLPDGQLHRIVGRFTEVEPPAVIAFDGGAETEEGELLAGGHTRVSFDEEDGRTRLTVAVTVFNVISASDLKQMEEGWLQILEKLAANISETRA